MCRWFSSFFEKPLVSRVKRRIPMRSVERRPRLQNSATRTAEHHDRWMRLRTGWQEERSHQAGLANLATGDARRKKMLLERRFRDEPASAACGETNLDRVDRAA